MNPGPNTTSIIIAVPSALLLLAIIIIILIFIVRAVRWNHGNQSNSKVRNDCPTDHIYMNENQTYVNEDFSKEAVGQEDMSPQHIYEEMGWKSEYYGVGTENVYAPVVEYVEAPPSTYDSLSAVRNK